jgi:MFS family permease
MMEAKQRLYLLFFAIFIFQMGFGIVTPILPLYADSFGLNTIAVGWVIAIYGVARVIADLPAVWLARLIGNPYAMAVGAVCLSVGSLLCGLAESYEGLLMSRFVAGAGSAITLVVGQSMVASNPGPFSRAKAISYYQGFFLAGVSLGPLLGGTMAGAFGIRAPFFLYAGIALFVAVIAVIFLQRADKRERLAVANSGGGHGGGILAHENEVSLWRSFLIIGRDVPFILISVLTLLQHFTRTGGINGLVPLHGTEVLHLSAAQIGYVMTVSGLINLAIVFVTGGLSDRWGRKALIVPSGIVIAASLLAFAFAQNYVWYLVAGLLWGLGAGISGPVSAAYVTDRVKGNNYESAMALYRMLSDVGYIIGPLLLGVFSQLYDIATALIATAVLFLISTWVFNRFSPDKDAPANLELNEPILAPAKDPQMAER